MNSDNDYEVGYGKPPENGRFKKGQSGNPKGRPKGVKNFQTELKEILDSKVTVTEAGKTKSVSTVMAVLMRLREMALKSNPRAGERLLAYAQESSSVNEAGSRERQLKQFELDILDRSGLDGGTDDREHSDDE